MWDLTKSMFSFSWAMSMLGVQQTLNLVKPGQAARAFDDITEAATEQFGGFVTEVFKAGNNLQRQIVGLNLERFGASPSDRPVGSSAPRQSTYSAVAPSVNQSNPVGNSQLPAAARNSTQTVSGWGPMPDAAQGGTPATQTPSPPSFAEPDISADYPFKANYVDVFGSRMHYIDEGAGETILLLHGNPTWSYLWRNVIPHLTPHARCIAPDLIGYGRSDKPDIEYRWFDHARYLEEFINQMGLKNITLVLHDQGSGLGFHYAMRHQNNIRAIAFFEAIVRPYPWDEFSTPDFREIFRKFRSGGVGGEGWKLIVDQNFFIEVLLPQAAGRPLTAQEMNYYREPFIEPRSRLPVWRFPRETPIGGEPADVWTAVSEYSRRLQDSDLPKLMLYAEPGALLTSDNVNWCKRHIKNLSSVFLGPGSHFLQESCPHRIGNEITKWYAGLPLR
jgi:haloalkane dehalogenase